MQRITMNQINPNFTGCIYNLLYIQYNENFGREEFFYYDLFWEKRTFDLNVLQIYIKAKKILNKAYKLVKIPKIKLVNMI